METVHDPASSDATSPGRWTRAVAGDREAFRELAGSYWYCVYAWWKRTGREDANAATLACFSRWLGSAPPKPEHTGAGRMREWVRARLAELVESGASPTESGGEPTIEIAPEWAEERYAQEPDGTADEIFQRRWALTVLEFTMDSLRGEYAGAGKEALFGEVTPYASFDIGGDDDRYEATARRMGFTVGAARKAVFDFRSRHRELLRGFVGDSVADPEEIDSELTALLCSCDMPGTPGEAAPLPTAIRQFKPDELLARAMRSVRMTSGGAGLWTPPTDAEVARLFPQYEMLGILGRGGMGAVYKARQIELDRLVAIKLLPLEISVDHDFADRFRREARAMAKLSHPNIISVFDFGTTNEGHLYFVMEFIEGANLQHMIHGPGVDPARALDIMSAVCDALDYAHNEGVIHRDIKPANVMVDGRGRVKVADFGLARLTDPDADQMGHTMTGTVMGTPDYMAPEQSRGMNVDHRADIYSLGVMLYEMLCREVPKGFCDPPSHRIGCDARIDEIVKRAMQSTPDRRYQTTQEMRTAIGEARASAELVPASTTALSGPTQVVQPRRAGGQTPRLSDETMAAGAVALELPTAAMMKAIAPPARQKSKLPFYVGIAVGLIAIAAGAVFIAKSTGGTRSGASHTSVTADGGDSGRSGARPSDALESGAIRLWDSPEKIPDTPNVAWKDNALFIGDGAVVRSPGRTRDLILRFTISLKSEVESLKVAIRSVGSTKEPRKYQLQISPRLKAIGLRVDTPEDGRTLQMWSLPAPKQGGSWLPIEVRAVGGDFTISADGELLGIVHDETIVEAGYFFLSATATGYFRDIVYVPLDKLAGATASPVVAERWEPALRLPGEHGDPTPTILKDGWILPRAGTAGALRSLLGTWRNGAIRAKYRDQSGSVCLRSNRQERYALFRRNNLLTLNYLPQTGAAIPLKRVAVPARPEGAVSTIELRAVDRRLIALLDGQEVFRVDDDRIERGEPAIIVNQDAGLRDVEVLNLDRPPLARAVSQSVPNVDPTIPATATKDAPFVNTLGMKFVPVPITGGPTGGQRVLFSVWETRVQDYEVFATEMKREWPKREFEQGPAHPCVNVTWENATAFCAWLTERERKAGKIGANESYRLPSDNEWSCAIGIGDREDPAKTPTEKSRKLADVFPWGTAWPPPANGGNYSGEECAGLKQTILPGYRDGFRETAPVGSFAANPLGIFDLGGNVREWCEDWVDTAHQQRAQRGASYNDGNPQAFLSSSRTWSDQDSFAPYTGFRVILATARPSTDSAPATVQSSQVLTYDGHRYQLVIDKSTWSEAKAKAEAIGGHLVTFSTDAEDVWLREHLIPPDGKPDQAYWIGGFAEERSEDFRWVTGESFGKVRWRRDHPYWRYEDAKKHEGKLFAAGLSVSAMPADEGWVGVRYNHGPQSWLHRGVGRCWSRTAARRPRRSDEGCTFRQHPRHEVRPRTDHRRADRRAARALFHLGDAGAGLRGFCQGNQAGVGEPAIRARRRASSSAYQLGRRAGFLHVAHRPRTQIWKACRR